MTEHLISPTDLANDLHGDAAPLAIDVRSADEFAAGHLPGALHVPLAELPERIAGLPRDRPLVTC